MAATDENMDKLIADQLELGSLIVRCYQRYSKFREDGIFKIPMDDVLSVVNGKMGEVIDLCKRFDKNNALMRTISSQNNIFYENYYVYLKQASERHGKEILRDRSELVDSLQKIKVNLLTVQFQKQNSSEVNSSQETNLVQGSKVQCSSVEEKGVSTIPPKTSYNATKDFERVSTYNTSTEIDTQHSSKKEETSVSRKCSKSRFHICSECMFIIDDDNDSSRNSTEIGNVNFNQELNKRFPVPKQDEFLILDNQHLSKEEEQLKDESNISTNNYKPHEISEPKKYGFADQLKRWEQEDSNEGEPKKSKYGFADQLKRWEQEGEQSESAPVHKSMFDTNNDPFEIKVSNEDEPKKSKYGFADQIKKYDILREEWRVQAEQSETAPVHKPKFDTNNESINMEVCNEDEEFQAKHLYSSLSRRNDSNVNRVISYDDNDSSDINYLEDHVAVDYHDDKKENVCINKFKMESSCVESAASENSCIVGNVPYNKINSQKPFPVPSQVESLFLGTKHDNSARKQDCPSEIFISPEKPLSYYGDVATTTKDSCGTMLDVEKMSPEIERDMSESYVFSDQICRLEMFVGKQEITSFNYLEKEAILNVDTNNFGSIKFSVVEEQISEFSSDLVTEQFITNKFNFENIIFNVSNQEVSENLAFDFTSRQIRELMIQRKVKKFSWKSCLKCSPKKDHAKCVNSKQLYLNSQNECSNVEHRLKGFNVVGNRLISLVSPIDFKQNKNFSISSFIKNMFRVPPVFWIVRSKPFREFKSFKFSRFVYLKTPFFTVSLI